MSQGAVGSEATGAVPVITRVFHHKVTTRGCSVGAYGAFTSGEDPVLSAPAFHHIATL